MRDSFLPTRRGRRSRGIVTALMVTLCLAAAAPVAAAPSASGKNPAVITTWNQIAVTTTANAVTPPASGPTNFIYFALTHIAMHNAVNGITGKYELYHLDGHPKKKASPEAAAAAAAHRILSTYFPAQAATLDVEPAGLARCHPGREAEGTGVSPSACGPRTASSPSGRMTAATRS